MGEAGNLPRSKGEEEKEEVGHIHFLHLWVVFLYLERKERTGNRKGEKEEKKKREEIFNFTSFVKGQTQESRLRGGRREKSKKARIVGGKGGG